MHAGLAAADCVEDERLERCALAAPWGASFPRLPIPSIPTGDVTFFLLSDGARPVTLMGFRLGALFGGLPSQSPHVPSHSRRG